MRTTPFRMWINLVGCGPVVVSVAVALAAMTTGCAARNGERASPRASSPPVSTVRIEPAELAFGTVWRGQAVVLPIQVTNVGDHPVNVAAGFYDSWAVDRRQLTDAIRPGQTRSIDVHINTRRACTSYRSTFSLTPSNGEMISIPITGSFRDVFISDPQTLLVLKQNTGSDRAMAEATVAVVYETPIHLTLRDHDRTLVSATLLEIAPGRIYILSVASTGNPWPTRCLPLYLDSEDYSDAVEFTVLCPQ